MERLGAVEVNSFSRQERWMFVARAVVSIVLLTGGLYILLKGGYPDAVTKWAIGVIGLVIGYWLR